tara:strand:+ start:161 stop:748 length:588 start_codon:yes stop_codon:yes gene_type:complete
MLRKKFFFWIVYCFFFIEKAFAAEEGMPQLNPEYWISQIFWLTVVFGSLYMVLSKLILPKISDNLESRKAQIAENVDSAEKQRENSDQKIKEYDKIIHDAKIEAKNIFNKARENILRDINSKKEILEKEIDEEVQKAEEEIIDLKKKSPEKINKIAIDTSADLVKLIIGADVNNSNISAIVEDVSKKGGVKYYDN